jgi:hypothetical protein
MNFLKFKVLNEFYKYFEFFKIDYENKNTYFHEKLFTHSITNKAK